MSNTSSTQRLQEAARRGTTILATRPLGRSTC